MTITLSLPLLIGLILSAVLFVGVTWLAYIQGMFDGGGGYLGGLNGAFIIALYAILWGVPSLAGWAVYATWFK